MLPILRKNTAYLFLNDAYLGSIACSISPLRLFSTSSKGDSVTSPAIQDVLLHKYQFSPQSAVETAAILNQLKDPANSELLLSSFKDYGFSNAQLEKIVKMVSSPQLLSCRPDIMKQKLEVLRSLGFPTDDIAKLVSRNTAILLSNLNTRVIPSFSRLKILLGTTDAVVKLCLRSPWLLSSDLESTVVRNMEFLKTFGIPEERVLKLLCNNPRCLMLKPIIFRKYVEKAEEMGAIRSSNVFIHAIQMVSSFSEGSWELKLQGFRKCGFSTTDIMNMFRKAPLMFSISTEKLQQVTGFLLANGKYSLTCIVNNPMSLAYSIEDRYVPRFKALEMLESKKLTKNWPGLSVLAKTPDEKFFEKFVHPYVDEVGDYTLKREKTQHKQVGSMHHSKT